jgi:lantibiotic modifying enzyme
LARVAAEAVTSEAYDLDVGIAGVIQAALAAACEQNGEPLHEAAFRLGNVLLKCATATKAGCTWPTRNRFGRSRLLGYAHGPSGIAAALVQLYACTGCAEFLATASRAIEYERSFHDNQIHNWPAAEASEDKSDQTTLERFPLCFCYGAPGIALARLAGTLREDACDLWARDLEAALDSCRTYAVNPSSYGNYSLWYGAAGNAEPLLLAAEHLNRPELREAAEVIGANGLARYQEAEMPWPCGLPGIGELPSLMLGIAGIGYFYLRLARQAQVGSTLLIGGPAPK